VVRKSDAVKALFDYFAENWNRTPYPVIDHALRINKLPDGSFHFYIHPANTGGTTTDFIVTAEEVKLRVWEEPNGHCSR
jgi:hypothetical protein